MSNSNSRVRFMISDVPESVLTVLDTLAESAGMDRGDALQCLLIDFFDGFRKAKGIPAHPLYPHWRDHHNHLVNTFSG